MILPISSTFTATAQDTLRALLLLTSQRARTLVMGILNVTPDSFSDGGRFDSVDTAVRHAQLMVADGADIVDVGGESTRPSTFRTAKRLGLEEELGRVLPVIQAIRERLPNVPISIDTYHADVAKQAIEAGATLVNDVSALRADPDMAEVCARSGSTVCLMHMPGLPNAIPENPGYGDVVADVITYLRRQIDHALNSGISEDKIIIDPGIGFGKSHEQNLLLLQRLNEIVALDYPVLVGASRKSMIGAVLGGLPPEERVEGTAATVALSIAKGAAIVRVHDVKEMARTARMSDAIVRSPNWNRESP